MAQHTEKCFSSEGDMFCAKGCTYEQDRKVERGEALTAFVEGLTALPDYENAPNAAIIKLREIVKEARKLAYNAQ